MKKYFNFLNIIFAIQLITIGLVAGGIIPKATILGLAVLVSIYVLLDSTENTLTYFVRSIPFFIAIPLTDYFDSFNIWRIASGLIFLKWFFRENITLTIISHLRALIKHPVIYFEKHHIITAISIFFVMAGFSLLVADEVFVGIKRIIYMANLSLISFVLFSYIKEKEEFAKRIIKNLFIPGLIVVGLGFAQLISTYFMSIFDFVDISYIVQSTWYGKSWADIALNNGNTWFAYFGSQLSLRMFSVFPDSHTFPIIVLMTIPSLLAIALTRVLTKSKTFKEMIKTRASLWIVALPIFYLAAILSGTRGIWLAVLAPILISPLILHYVKSKNNKSILKYLMSFLIIFFLLFLIANPIFTSDQFKVQKEGGDILKQRIRSIINLSETSNSGRIFIWKKSLESIAERPLLGVGIGNYPTVLEEGIDTAKAGASAHNLYLHIASEIGLVGLFVSLVLLWKLIVNSVKLFNIKEDPFLKIYLGSFIVYILWILAYLMTDATLFDERAFLFFSIHMAIVFGLFQGDKLLKQKIN